MKWEHVAITGGGLGTVGFGFLSLTTHFDGRQYRAQSRTLLEESGDKARGLKSAHENPEVYQDGVTAGSIAADSAKDEVGSTAARLAGGHAQQLEEVYIALSVISFVVLVVGALGKLRRRI